MKRLSSMHGLVITQNTAVIRLRNLAIIFIDHEERHLLAISQNIHR